MWAWDLWHWEAGFSPGCLHDLLMSFCSVQIQSMHCQTQQSNLTTKAVSSPHVSLWPCFLWIFFILCELELMRLTRKKLIFCFIYVSQRVYDLLRHIWVIIIGDFFGWLLSRRQTFGATRNCFALILEGNRQFSFLCWVSCTFNFQLIWTVFVMRTQVLVASNFTILGKCFLLFFCFSFPQWVNYWLNYFQCWTVVCLKCLYSPFVYQHVTRVLLIRPL